MHFSFSTRLMPAVFGRTVAPGSTTGAYARKRPIPSMIDAPVRSRIVRRVILMAYALAVGLLWIGAAMSIMREIIAWWAAVEYGTWTSAAPWPQW